MDTSSNLFISKPHKILLFNKLQPTFKIINRNSYLAVFIAICGKATMSSEKSAYSFIANPNKSKPVLHQGNNFSCPTNWGSFP